MEYMECLYNICYFTNFQSCFGCFMEGLAKQANTFGALKMSTNI